MFEAIVIGNLAVEPELRTPHDQDPVCTLGLIHNWFKSQRDEHGNRVRVEYSQWVNAVCWGKELSEKANALKKGDEVRVKGSVSFPTFTRKNGAPGVGVEIRVTELTALTAESEEPS